MLSTPSTDTSVSYDYCLDLCCCAWARTLLMALQYSQWDGLGQAAVRTSKQIVPLWHSGSFPPENLVVELGALQYIKVKGDKIDSGADQLVQQLRRMHANITGGDHVTRTGSRHNIHSDQPVGEGRHQPMQRVRERTGWSASTHLAFMCGSGSDGLRYPVWLQYASSFRWQLLCYGFCKRVQKGHSAQISSRNY